MLSLRLILVSTAFPRRKMHIEVELTVDTSDGLKVDFRGRVDARIVQQEVLRLNILSLAHSSLELERLHAGLVDLNVPNPLEHSLRLDVHVDLRLSDLIRSVRCEQVHNHPRVLFVSHKVELLAG